MWEISARPEVEDDLVSAVAWYDDRRAGLGREFLVEYLAAVQRVHENPLQFGVAATGLRACRIKRFSYIIHFQTQGKRLLIVAVMSAGRDEGAFHYRRG